MSRTRRESMSSAAGNCDLIGRDAEHRRTRRPKSQINREDVIRPCYRVGRRFRCGCQVKYEVSNSRPQTLRQPQDRLLRVWKTRFVLWTTEQRPLRPPSDRDDLTSTISARRDCLLCAGPRRENQLPRRRGHRRLAGSSTRDRSGSIRDIHAMIGPPPIAPCSGASATARPRRGTRRRSASTAHPGPPPPDVSAGGLGRGLVRRGCRDRTPPAHRTRCRAYGFHVPDGAQPIAVIAPQRLRTDVRAGP